MPTPSSRTETWISEPTRVRAQLDPAAGQRELGRVVEQVHEHLRQAHRVRLHVHRDRRQLDAEPVALGLDLRAAGLDRPLDHRAQVDHGAGELDLARSHARGILQVLDQAREELGLAPEHRVEPLELRVRVALLEHVQGVRDRRERVAQLVRQRGEELVLALVGAQQRLLHANAIRNVDRHAADPARAGLRTGHRELDHQRVVDAVLVLERSPPSASRGPSASARSSLRRNCSAVSRGKISASVRPTSCSRGTPNDALRLGVREHVAPVLVLDPGQAGQVLHELREA
jgi:hypothetical protein